MKTILNKATDIEYGSSKVSYFDLCKMSLDIQPEGGFDVTTMRQRIMVADKLVSDEAELEDSEYETLKSCIENMKWTMAHKDIVGFVDYVLSL